MQENVGELEAYYAEDAETAKTLLKEHTFKHLFLDHDLGGEENVSTSEENSGSNVVDYMIKHTLQKDALIVIHSLNEPAAISMESKLNSNGFKAQRLNFLLLKNL